MADEENVWSPGGVEPEALPAPVSTGETAYDEGNWINQTFSLEVIFKMGFGLLADKPILVLGIGAMVWVLEWLPILLSTPFDVGLGVIEEMGGMNGYDPRVIQGVGQAASSLIGMFFQLLVAPFFWMVATGGVLAFAHAMRTDEMSWGIVFGSWRRGLEAFLNQLLAGIIQLVVAVVVIVPLVGIGFGLINAGMPMFGALTVAVLAIPAWVALLYVQLPLQLSVLAVILDGKGAIEALRIGWHAAEGARVTLFLFGVIYSVGWLVGCLLLCVGQAPINGLLLAGATAAWLLHARRPSELKEWPFFQRHPLSFL